MDGYRPVIDDWPAFLEACGRDEPQVFRVRTGRISEAELTERLSAQGFVTRAIEGMPGFRQVERGPGPVSFTREHWQGLIYVQQASTGVAAPTLGARPGEKILDLCAAPGGKTTHVAELMDDRGCLVANEISEGRIRGLLGNVYRLGHPGILVVASDGRDFPEGALFDRVLVDAPCTGEGTLRRRGGNPPEPSASFVAHLGRVQRALLEKAVRVTRPGGTILYVTCTFAPEENEAVVSDVLGSGEVELEPLTLDVPHARGLAGFEGERFDDRLEGAARVYPHHLDSGGLFLARLRRVGESGASGEGWSPVPPVFPACYGEETESPPTGAEAIASEEALLAAGVVEVQERFGVARDLGQAGWLMRGGRAWMHTLAAWPLESWTPGDWRPISVGLRAIEFDSKARARPTNDLLRLLGADVGERVLDLTDEELDALLERRPVATSIDDRGPYALRHDGEVIGRGAITKDGLKSEIPKARASDLRRLRSR